MDDELRQILGEINKNMATKDDIGKLESRMGGMESKIGNLESRMGGMESKMGGMESKIGNLESRMDDMANKMVTKDDLSDALVEVRKIMREELRDVRIEFGHPMTTTD